ncbi:hypothetical protein SAMN04244579_01427 [Azotobacter beijerinckii]|uniref:Uncharacterized protein n=1 Tax=Azotobacter beijerinckii TaxID=170623 RepID=A0A1H6SEZ6_9GAMM|nr:hypothetical protein SAMN04244579_01427 [Azotobacter beijerinckii]
MTSLSPSKDSLEYQTMRKLGFRLIPFLVLCYFIAYGRSELAPIFPA